MKSVTFKKKKKKPYQCIPNICFLFIRADILKIGSRDKM